MSKVSISQIAKKVNAAKEKYTHSRKIKFIKFFDFLDKEGRILVAFLAKILYYIVRYAYLHTYYGQKGENVDDKETF